MPRDNQDTTMQFTGFVRGTRATPLPDPLFGLLLEQVQDLAELKIVLRGVWLRNRKKGAFRPVFLQEFLGDPVLLRGLAAGDASPERRILQGLALAVGHGVFLHCPALAGQEGAGDGQSSVDQGEFFLLNTQEDREALTHMGLVASADYRPGQAPAGATPAGPGARSNVFALYEDNIGTIGPLVAGQLQDVEGRYPAAWIAEAFDIAVARNARNLAYVEAILRRWDAEGKDHGEPGRHSPPDHSQKHLQDYQRRWGIPPDRGA